MIELIDGGGVSQLKSVVKQLTYVKSADIEFATVLAPPPSIRVVVDGMKIELDADDLSICESLTKTTRDIKFKADVAIKVDIDGTLRDGTIKTGTSTSIETDNALKAGDRVVIASINDGQLYVILDRLGGVK
ncbi:hypothetical protein J2T13_000138 [Paenibacillus sp. DS2015]|uniref:DUF2577 domain-containing protein n=1 Tax=Paenibacillus sp. DS2015 TaxID=3373917 RepID=UPI003D2325C0